MKKKCLLYHNYKNQLIFQQQKLIVLGLISVCQRLISKVKLFFAILDLKGCASMSITTLEVVEFQPFERPIFLRN